MHPDSPIRQLDEAIRRYGVTCFKATPYSGGGYCVELGSTHPPIIVGGGSLHEAIGLAFQELLRLGGSPSIEELIERSSLGTKRAKAARASADPETVRKVLEKTHTYADPAIHWRRYPVRSNDPHAEVTSACGMVRTGGTHAKFAETPEFVTCGRCKRTSWYLESLRGRSRQS